MTGLGLPIRQDIQKLALTCFVETAQTGLMLLESPSRSTSPKTSAWTGRVQSLAQPRVVAPLPAVAARPGGPTLAAGRNLAARRALIGKVGARLPELAPPGRPTPIILFVVAIRGGYRVELDAAALAASGAVQDEVVVAERIGRGVAFYKGRLERPPRGAKRIFVNVLQELSCQVLTRRRRSQSCGP